MYDDKENILMNLVTEHAQYAAICTEPAMIALAASKASGLLKGEPERIDVSVSPGVLKNALSAGLPCGDRKGPDVAAALGYVVGDTGRGLQILGNVSPDEMMRAYALVDAGVISLNSKNDADSVYARVTAKKGGHTAEVTISGSHTNITGLVLDGQSLHEGKVAEKSGLEVLRALSFQDLYALCLKADPKDLDFLMEGAKSNVNLALKSANNDGSRHSLLGLSREEQLRPGLDSHEFGLLSTVYKKVMAAISARMGGTSWAVLTSGGSGNQGIMLGIPVLELGEALGKESDDIKKALYLGHAVNLYVKGFMGSISSVCGAVSAGAGVAAAASWLLDRDYAAVKKSVDVVLAALYGMLCDGAKASCALKGSIGSLQGLSAAFMVHNKLVLPESEGIIGATIEETLGTIAYLNSRLFSPADGLMLDRLFKE